MSEHYASRIEDVEALAIAIPLARPVSFSTRTVRAREFLVTRVRTVEGTEGVGYAYAGTTGGRVLVAAVSDILRPILLGQDPWLIGSLWEAMFQESLLLGRRGALLRAMSGIDIALWDLLAKTLGVPLYRLLGGHRQTVPAYASGGYYRDGKGLRELAVELEGYAGLGFTDFKIKVGGAPLHEDVERVRTARTVIGPPARLALDANNAYRTPAEAVAAGRAFEPFDIWWFEEPLMPDHLDGLAQVTAELDVPVATGEIEATRWGFRDLISHRAADILQPDAGVVGGVTEWMRVAHAAATFDLPVAPHWHADLHIHLAGAAQNCLTVEYFRLEEDVYNFERVLAERLQPSANSLVIPERPGLGLVLNEQAIQLYRVA